MPFDAPALGLTHHDGVGEAVFDAGEAELQAQGLHALFRQPALVAQIAQARRFAVEHVDVDALQAALADRQPTAERGVAIAHAGLSVQPQDRRGEMIEGGGFDGAHCTILVQIRRLRRNVARK